MNRYLKYIGLSFKDYDCYNLVKLIYKEVHDRDILDTNIKHYESDLINQSYLGEVDNWIEVKEPKEGDIMAIRLDSNYPNLVTHFAYCINDKQIIHTTENTGCIVENISKYYRLSSGFYRHKDLV
jgi:hypothetical protein